MLKIKLARFGKRNQPHYRIVVNEAKTKRDGQYVEMLGKYAPTQDPKLLELDLERYTYWVKHEAKQTETVAYLATKVESGKPYKKKKAKKKSKKAAKKQKKEDTKKKE